MLPRRFRGNRAGQSHSLLERTRAMLEATPRSLKAKDIAKATGLSEAWLSRFHAGKIPNPGVVQVQTLYDYLAARK
jgi:predicted transcriptional regulator